VIDVVGYLIKMAVIKEINKSPLSKGDLPDAS
jgi:hypothetical protein